MVPWASVLMRYLFLSPWFWPILLYLEYFQTVLSLDPHLIQSVNLCFLIGVLIPFLNLPYCYFFLFIHLFFAPYFHVPSLCLYYLTIFFSIFSPLLTHQLYHSVSLESVLCICNILRYYTTFVEYNKNKLFRAWLFVIIFT